MFGPHDANFHALWDGLRSEHETLLMKGYTGEGFLSKGQRLGGGRPPPPDELRRLARANAEKRQTLIKNSGKRLGGSRIRPGEDPRKKIVDSIERRTKMDRGCVSNADDAGKLARQATQKAVTTRGEQDDANDRAIAEALLELMEEEENTKLEGTYATPPATGGLTWTPEGGLSSHRGGKSSRPVSVPELSTEEEQMEWALQESMKAAAAATPPSPEKPRHAYPTLGFSPRRPSEGNEGQPISQVVREAIVRSNKRSRSTSPSTGPKRESAKTNNGQDPRINAEIVDLAGAISAANPPEALDSWTCEICTCINPLNYLTCDACGIERPLSVRTRPERQKRTGTTRGQQSNKPAWTRGLVPDRAPPATLGWNCQRCGAFMEHKWWSCSSCGRMKSSSEANEHVV